MRLRLLVLALCAGLAVPAVAVQAAAAPDCTGLPKHSKLAVVDAANVVPPDEEAWLTTDLMRHHISGHEALVAVTVQTLGNDDVSSYAKRLFDCWGIGDAQSDNGVLILVAMRERRARIELGAGLEGRLTEAQLDAALAQMVGPLRAGGVGAALRAAAVAVVRDLGGELPDTRVGTNGSPPRSADPGDVTDGGVTDGGVTDGGAPPAFDPLYQVDPDAGPFGPADGGGGSGLAVLVPVLIVLGIVGSIVRAIFRGAGFANLGGSSSWRGGFPMHGAGWHDQSVLRGGSWHVGAQDSGWSGGSSWGDSGGSGSSGGSFGGSSGSSGSSGSGSFGGGSSGGGGASGSW